MIASVAFRNFKALRSAQVALGPFNLLIGPNGSGKTSLIQAIFRLRALARLPLAGPRDDEDRMPGGPEITFRFEPPHDGVEALLSCVSDTVCDLLQLVPLPHGGRTEDWPELRRRLQHMREYSFDAARMVLPVSRRGGEELAANGSNLAAVLAHRQATAPAAFAALRDELARLLPEYDDIILLPAVHETVGLELQLAGHGGRVAAESLSQGTLQALALLALAFDPEPPSVLCIEELDRGLHPRLLRETRDALYRLSYPADFGLSHPPVQIIATTHSPYLLDLFREHPEEVVIAQKEGTEARFVRLSDRPDIDEILREGSLGDMWYAGLLGGVPGEK